MLRLRKPACSSSPPCLCPALNQGALGFPAPLQHQGGAPSFMCPPQILRPSPSADRKADVLILGDCSSLPREVTLTPSSFPITFPLSPLPSTGPSGGQEWTGCPFKAPRHPHCSKSRPRPVLGEPHHRMLGCGSQKGSWRSSWGEAGPGKGGQPRGWTPASGAHRATQGIRRGHPTSSGPLPLCPHLNGDLPPTEAGPAPPASPSPPSLPLPGPLLGSGV